MPRPRKKVIEENTPESVPVAPAPRQETTRVRGRHMSTPAFVGVFIFMTLVVVGTAILVGRSDRGQIDVNAAINSANQTNRELYGDEAVQVNTVREDLRNLPNGGLIPQENQPESTPPQDTEINTATSTDAGTASSTEAGTERAETESPESTPPESAETSELDNTSPPAEGV